MSATLTDRFWAKVKKTDTCWLWTAHLLPNGYGRIQKDGRLEYAHRVSHEAFIGPIPQGYHVDHLCRVRNCVNPAHLEAVTPAENVRRAMPYMQRAVKAKAPARTRRIQDRAEVARQRAAEVERQKVEARAAAHAAHLERVRVLMGWSR